MATRPLTEQEIEATLFAAAGTGLAEVTGADEHGNLSWRVTEEGEARVSRILAVFTELAEGSGVPLDDILGLWLRGDSDLETLDAEAAAG